MATPINTLTGDIPLQLAQKISDIVLGMWNDGAFLDKVTPTTADLLKFWFCEPHTSQREINFHRGQKNAILNTIYLHEILKVDSVLEIYEKCDKELIPKFNHTLWLKRNIKYPNTP